MKQYLLKHIQSRKESFEQNDQELLGEVRCLFFLSSIATNQEGFEFFLHSSKSIHHRRSRVTHRLPSTIQGSTLNNIRKIVGYDDTVRAIANDALPSWPRG